MTTPTPPGGAPHFCTSCGAGVEPGAAFCTECGHATATPEAAPPTAVVAPPVTPAAVAPPVVPPPAGWVAGVPGPPPPPPRKSSGGWLVPLLVLGGLAVLLALALVVLIVARNGDSEPTASSTAIPQTLPGSTATTAAASTTTPPTTGTAPTTTATPTTRAPAVTDVAQLPSGLLCRDLSAQGWSYSEAVDYWSLEGYPDRMDADLNGIPCETVYPRSAVSAYWGDVAPPSGVADVPSGLLCRDLLSRGLSYPEAVAYWFAEGSPDRMDEDLNGIPCETVYPSSDVSAYWG